MEVKEIREMSTEELKRKEVQLREDLFRLRLRHTSHQLENTAALKKIRKDIARIKTVLREREV